VWVVEGFQPKKVSDEFIEKILDAEGSMAETHGYGLRTVGHMLFLINLKNQNRTLVYDFDEKLWAPIRKLKKRMPRSVYLIGNHEQRIHKAVDIQPELEGVVSFNDLDLKKNYDEVVHYEGLTPGTIEVDGIHYAHYFTSGLMGRPISGDIRPAHTLLLKRHVSSTQAHSHSLDFGIQATGDGRKIMGMFAGCAIDYEMDWAGLTNDLWWRGVVVKHNVENGVYDPEFISLQRLKDIYGS